MKELLLYENALSLLSVRAFSYITNEFIVAYLLKSSFFSVFKRCF
jgi:hypothetical protein